MRPYKFSVKDKYYEFSTAAGTRYACYFLSYANYFTEYKDIAENMFAFNIDILEKGTTGITDPRIGITVVKIIKTFLTGLTHAVIYVCDSGDRRELLRKRKFDNWFREYDDGTIIKINGHISTDDFDIYNAILIHKDNPKKNRFIEAFTDLNSIDEK